ncbi:DUF59 domain-containing protein [Neomegalonema sp.]|uniref:DUF59 domain-containing protein n=1 Tax=Neomegalonema sp. TaxID=2039713 RepID=UPI00260D34D4|nr:DUF59 domain-containing protein [Neomegalonema sp.]MDD2867039.1 DUF59 domain-containing protein [Neomegalonema sp.]
MTESIDRSEPAARSGEEAQEASRESAEAAGVFDPPEGSPLLAPSSVEHPVFPEIEAALRTIYDPEIPVNIYDLGLVYAILIDAEGAVKIEMTLTAPGCPVAGEMPGWVVDAVEPLPGIRQVEVDLVWDPPWTMDRLTDEAKLELGYL